MEIDAEILTYRHGTYAGKTQLVRSLHHKQTKQSRVYRSQAN